jgi:F-type H+-transporting ATPase subunit b
MPQFNPAFFAPQIFWLAITFVVLYFLMAKLALPRISAVLDERQRRIDENLDRAAQLKAEADIAVSAYERALTSSRIRSQEMLKETAERLGAEAERRNRELGARLAEQIKSGEARIAAAAEAALAHVRDIALDVAGIAARSVTGQNPDQAVVEAAVAAIVGDRGEPN